MPWLFIILGLVAFISGLYGLITALQARRMFLLEAAELALLAVAWLMHHTTTAGWIALWAALGLDALRRARALRQTPSVAGTQTASDIEVPSIVTPSENEAVAPSPPAKPLAAPLPSKPPRPAAPPLVSIALLRAAWQPAPEVFLASLRRGGERGAKLTSGSQGPSIRLSVDGVALELECVARPLPRHQIDDAAAQSWDWPDAAKTVAAHVGHVVFTTRANGGASRAASVRLHCRAHQALAEFAPVIAVLWPAAGRLIPVASLSQVVSIAGDFELAKATCINFRTFPLEDAEAGRFLCDTVGFSAFGVADLEVESPGAPSEALTAAIYERSQQMFESEHDINTEGAALEHGGSSWRIERGRSHFAPDRDVARWVPATA